LYSKKCRKRILLSKLIFNIQEEFEEAKRSTEAVNGRKIDNTMVKRKGTKGQTMMMD
jgi:hypothetical protein